MFSDSAANDFEPSSPEELRGLTPHTWIPQILEWQERIAQDEVEACKAALRLGHSYKYCRGPGYPIVVCKSLDQLEKARGKSRVKRKTPASNHSADCG